MKPSYHFLFLGLALHSRTIEAIEIGSVNTRRKPRQKIRSKNREIATSK
jgi:hypothetical protein